MVIITEGLIQLAINLAKPSVEKILQRKYLIWGPSYVRVCLRAPNIPMLEFGMGTPPDKWEEAWGEEMDFASIARQKALAAEHGKANTSTVVAIKPWILQVGDYLYPGGAYRDGIAVGVSGARGRADEAIAEILIDCIILLAHLEADGRIAADQMQL